MRKLSGAVRLLLDLSERPSRDLRLEDVCRVAGHEQGPEMLVAVQLNGRSFCQEIGWYTVYTEFEGALAEAAAGCGQFGDALGVTDRALAYVNASAAALRGAAVGVS
jgi:hypothetical protein